MFSTLNLPNSSNFFCVEAISYVSVRYAQFTLIHLFDNYVTNDCLAWLPRFHEVNMKGYWLTNYDNEVPRPCDVIIEKVY